jgi:hypothetical protein
MLHFNREYFFVNGLLHKKACGKSVDREGIERTEYLCEKPLEGTERVEFPEKDAV